MSRRRETLLRTASFRSVRRELVLFAVVGVSVAVVGHELLLGLLGLGLAAGVANALQAVATLQLNFLANRALTWRPRVARSGVPLWRRWLRFQVARLGSLLLSVALFPLLAPVLSPSPAYWLLLGAGAVANFGSDKYWSFRPRRRALHAVTGPDGRELPAPIGPRRLTAAIVAVVVGTVALAVLWLDGFLVLVSAFMVVVAGTTLVFQLYKWWRPEHNDPHRYGLPDSPRLPGAILVPMRDEEAVAGSTLRRLADLDHPRYWVVPIVDHGDDMATARIAHAAARRNPDRVLVCPYPEDTEVHNKPIGLNRAVRMLHELDVPYEWVGIADAEDLFHPALLRMVDHRFRTTGAGIVQCGVQLMNATTDPAALPVPAGPLGRVRRWWRAHASGWWRAANVLEYFKWFQSRLKLQAAAGVMPLGGNTVFFRREFLEALRDRYGEYWDEDCLTEDCKIGIVASVLGYQVDVVYVEELVTREETPATLGGFLRQRVRWMQGFIQVFAEREWTQLPTLGKRVLAVYVLGFQFLQALAGLLAPIGLALALAHKAPVAITLLATVPLGISLLSVALDVLMLAQFGRTFGVRVRLRDHVGLVLGAYPFQLVLSAAAAWAVARFAIGRNDWVKTDHHGTHLDAAGVETLLPRPRAAAPAAGEAA
jgi:cellulose synthase/poly-beta-1,6-N-acetylglucosamine synthase-like glycosyltransferase/putative flippase GtrA